MLSFATITIYKIRSSNNNDYHCPFLLLLHHCPFLPLKPLLPPRPLLPPSHQYQATRVLSWPPHTPTRCHGRRYGRRHYGRRPATAVAILTTTVTAALLGYGRRHGCCRHDQPLQPRPPTPRPPPLPRPLPARPPPPRSLSPRRRCHGRC